MPYAASENHSLRRLSAKDRRRFRRVIMETTARCMWLKGEEFEAKTVDLAAGGLSLKTDQPFNIGDELVMYIDGLGRLSGKVARKTAFGFAVSFKLAPLKRERIADQLTWIVNKDALHLSDDRKSNRRNIGGSLLVVAENGVATQCDVVDLSLTGVGLATTGPKPRIGERVKVGSKLGRCSRYIDNGFAVEFIR